jgi:hypothetical protein
MGAKVGFPDTKEHSGEHTICLCASARFPIEKGRVRYNSDLCWSANRSRLLVPRRPSFWQMLTRWFSTVR